MHSDIVLMLIKEQALDPRFIDDLARKLSEAMPGGIRSLQEDLEGNFKAVLRGALGKLDLVTREEFEVQSAVLARTRERLKDFESRVIAMESAGGRKAAGKSKARKTPAKKKPKAKSVK